MNVLLVHPRGAGPDTALLDRAATVEASAISDARTGIGAVRGVSLIGGSSRVAAGIVSGPALTVRTGSEDNLALHLALEAARPGDVIVVEAPADSVSAVMGDLMCRYALTLGVRAIVIDGFVRDAAELAAAGLPIYARGTCHIGPTKLGPGELHGLVRVGGVTVQDGDLVVADLDGVTIVAAAEAESAVTAAEAVMEREAGIRRAIEAGTWDRGWVISNARIVELSPEGEAS